MSERQDGLQLAFAYGGIPPFQKHSETSRAAGEAIRPKLNTLQRRVYAFIAGRGSNGATDFEIEHFLSLMGSTVRPRRRELQIAGLIKPSGMTRLTASQRKAIVWVRIL